MADILWAYSIGEDVNGNQITVQIWGPDDGRGAVEFTAGFPLCTLKWAMPEDEIFQATMMPSEANINFIIETTAQETLINEITNSYDNTHAVQILLGANRYWTGMLIADSISVEFMCEPNNLNIRATDSLNLLKDVNTHSFADVEIVNLYRSLEQLAFWQFYPDTDQSIFYNPQFEVPAATGQVITDVIFYRQFENDYDKLHAWLNDTGSFIVQHNGYWYIIGWLNYKSGALSGTWYKRQAYTPVSSTTITYSTIDVNADAGGVQRYSRPWPNVETVFVEQDLDQRYQFYQGTTTHSPAVDTYTETVFSKLIKKPNPGNKLNIGYYLEMTKTVGSSSHENRFRFRVTYDGEVFDVLSGQWSPTGSISWRETVTGFAGTNIQAMGNFTVPIGQRNADDNKLLTIEIDFFLNPGQTFISETDYAIHFINDQDSYPTHSVNAVNPRLELKHYYSSGDNFAGDMLESASSGYISTNWQYSAGLGSPTGALSKLRADAIFDEIAQANTLFEIGIDNMDGPINFYRTKKLQRMVALHFEQDMQRREGKIIGLKI